MAENRIITFANQKGGVGKSTLCTLFANYLSMQNKPVLVLDCDPQKSIYKRRKIEEQQLPDFKWFYNVQDFSLQDDENVNALMSNLRQLNGTILIDAPGNLVQPGLVSLLTKSDCIIVPIQYESSVMTSTMEFLQWVDKRLSENSRFLPKLIFLPNRHKAWCGTKTEKEKINETDALLSQVGILSPKIGEHKDLERVQTTILMKMQQKFVKETFAFIFENIFNAKPQIQ